MAVKSRKYVSISNEHSGELTVTQTQDTNTPVEFVAEDCTENHGPRVSFIVDKDDAADFAWSLLRMLGIDTRH